MGPSIKKSQSEGSTERDKDEERLRDKLRRRQEKRRASQGDDHNSNGSGIPSLYDEKDNGSSKVSSSDSSSDVSRQRRRSSEDREQTGRGVAGPPGRNGRRDDVPPDRYPRDGRGARHVSHERSYPPPGYPRGPRGPPHPAGYRDGRPPHGWGRDEGPPPSYRHGRGGRHGPPPGPPHWRDAGPPPGRGYGPPWRGGPPPPPLPPPPRDYHRRRRGRSRSRSVSSSRSFSDDESRSHSGRSVSSRSYSSRSSRSSRSGGRRQRRGRSRSRSYSSDESAMSRRSRSPSVSSASSSRSGAGCEMDDENSLITKDQRTVFVSQLVMRASEKELRRYFKKKVDCKVNDISMLRDKRTGRHKGCAYVELRTMQDVQRAVAVSGAAPDFQRFPILIKASEAEKNYVVAPPPLVPAKVPGSKTHTTPLIDKEGQAYEAQKVYVGNLDARVSNEQLLQLFGAFGELNKVQIQIDAQSGVSRGFAFLSFRDPKDANLAIETMAGQLLAGRGLKTGWASQPSSTSGVEARTTVDVPEDKSRKIQKAHNVLTKLTGAGLTGLSVAGLTGSYLAVDAIPTGKVEVPAKVLASSPSITADPKQVGRADKPTTMLLVQNMFNKDEETDPNWEEDIRLDFQDECSKYGKLLSVVVMSKLPGGKIYARFSAIDEAKTCASNLAGRWFDKRQLRVEFVDEIPEN